MAYAATKNLKFFINCFQHSRSASLAVCNLLVYGLSMADGMFRMTIFKLCIIKLFPFAKFCFCRGFLFIVNLIFVLTSLGLYKCNRNKTCVKSSWPEGFIELVCFPSLLSKVFLISCVSRFAFRLGRAFLFCPPVIFRTS